MTGQFNHRTVAIVARAGAKKRQATIARLIETVRARTGHPPTEDEIAATLAMSVKRVRFHLNATKDPR